LLEKRPDLLLASALLALDSLAQRAVHPTLLTPSGGRPLLVGRVGRPRHRR
jgi:hypothetical protein